MSLLIYLYQRLAMRPTPPNQTRCQWSTGHLCHWGHLLHLRHLHLYPEKSLVPRPIGLLPGRNIRTKWMNCVFPPCWQSARTLDDFAQAGGRTTSPVEACVQLGSHLPRSHGVMRTVDGRYCPCRWYRPCTSSSSWPWTWSTLGCMFARFLQCSGLSHFSVFL